MNKAALTIALVSLICTGCATTGGDAGEEEPVLIDSADISQAETAAAIEQSAATGEGGSKQEEGEVPLAVAESEQPEQAPPPQQVPEEVIVQGRSLNRPAVIHDLVTEAQTLLRDVELQYVFTGKGKVNSSFSSRKL